MNNNSINYKKEYNLNNFAKDLLNLSKNLIPKDYLALLSNRKNQQDNYLASIFPLELNRKIYFLNKEVKYCLKNKQQYNECWNKVLTSLLNSQNKFSNAKNHIESLSSIIFSMQCIENLKLLINTFDKNKSSNSKYFKQIFDIELETANSIFNLVKNVDNFMLSNLYAEISKLILNRSRQTLKMCRDKNLLLEYVKYSV